MTFVAETIERLFSKTPWYFRVVQIAGLILTLVTGIPTFLQEIDVVLSAPYDMFANKLVLVAGVMMTTVSQLSKVEPKTHPTDIPEKLKQEEIKTKEGTI